MKTLLPLIALFLVAVTAQAQSTLPGQPAAGLAGASELTLGTLDQIEVNVASYPDLKTVTRIGADGSVILPLVGTVTIAGMTPPRAAKTIEGLLARGGFIKAPSVRVEVLDYQSRKASVLGEVNNQGLVVLDRNYSVAEILAKAGGLAGDAADTAVIIRQKPGGGSERITIDIGELVTSGGAGALTRVEAGDVVFVPKAPTFSVIGAVNRAGTYALRKGMTIDQALAAAGDINSYGSRSKLKVRRTSPESGVVMTVVVKPDDALQPGDIVVVGERIF